MNGESGTRNQFVWTVAIFVLAAVAHFSNPVNLPAEQIEVLNADFEMQSAASPTKVPGGFQYIGSIPGWDVVNAGGIFQPDFGSMDGYPAAVQVTTGNFTAYSTNNGFGLVTQLQSPELTLEADRIYVISFDLGHRPATDFSGGFGFFRLANPFPAGLSIALADDPGSGNFTRQTHILNGADIPGSDLGDQFRIGFFALPGFVVDADNVSFEVILPGDVNLDGIVNLLDVQDFIDLIESGQFQEEADINRDGVVNLLDVDDFVELLAG